MSSNFMTVHVEPLRPLDQIFNHRTQHHNPFANKHLISLFKLNILEPINKIKKKFKE